LRDQPAQKTRKASVKRPDAQIEPFYVACANPVNVWLTGADFNFNAGAF
jgi:hypothetical protein